MSIANGLTWLTSGLLVTVLAGIGYWYLHTQYGKSIPGIAWFVFTFVLLLGFVTPWGIRGFWWAVSNNQTAWEEGQSGYYKTNPKALIEQKAIDEAIKGLQFIAPNGSGKSSGSADSATDGTGGQQQAAIAATQAQTGPVYKDVLLMEAIKLWFLEKGGCLKDGARDLTCSPSDWIDAATDTSFIPLGVTASTECTLKCDWTIAKKDQVWTITLSTPTDLGLSSVVIRTNSYMAEDSRTFKGTSGSATTVAGSGNWSTCAACWTQILVSTPVPIPTATASPAAGASTVTETPAPSGGGATTTTAYTLIENSPNIRTPTMVSQTMVCTDNDPLSSTVTGLKSGDTVNVIQLFDVSVEYNNVKQRALFKTSAGEFLCMHAGVLKQ